MSVIVNPFDAGGFRLAEMSAAIQLLPNPYGRVGQLNEDEITRLVGAILLEQNDESAVQRCRYMTPETITALAMILPSACRTWQPFRANEAR